MPEAKKPAAKKPAAKKPIRRRSRRSRWQSIWRLFTNADAAVLIAEVNDFLAGKDDEHPRYMTSTPIFADGQWFVYAEELVKITGK